MKTPHRRLSLASCALVLVACADADFGTLEQPDEWTDFAGGRWRALAVDAAGDVGFTMIPAEWSNVTFSNTLTETSLLENQMRTNGSGVAVADVDGDGRPDIYFARLDGPNALYRNLGNWTFEDVTASSGLAAADRFSTGVAFADIDGDADPDLILTSIGGPKSIFLNDGAGRFEPIEAGLAGTSGAMSVALADIDGDADLDLYLTNYKSVSVLDLFSPEEGAFPNTVRETADGYEVVEAFEPHYEIVERAGVLSRREKAEGDELYLNDGSGRFQLVAWDGGRFQRSDGDDLEAAPLDWGLAAKFGDLDADGDPDLYVANDLHSPDRLWLNQGDGTFRAASPWAVRTTSASSMAVDFSDVDRDGDQDIFLIDMLSRSSRLKKTQSPVARIEHLPPGDIESTQQVNRNALLLNRGDGTFAEVANYAGVEASDWSWSAVFLDVDLDGYEDLLIPNGHIRDLMDADTQIRIQSLPLEEARRSILLYEPLPLPNVAFRNGGDLTFEEVGQAWGIADEPDISHGAALADFDGDGDLDLVVNRLDRPAGLFRNDAQNARVAIRIVGDGPNTDGIGAVLRFEAAGLPVQIDEVAAGGGYLSGSEPLVVFAMGGAATGSLLVRGRDGREQRIEIEGPNRLYEISWPQGPSAPDDAGSVATTDTGSPWFELDPVFGPVHTDPVVDDAGRQPLLPFRMSQMGPRLAWHDLDGDEDPDLMIGSGSGAPPLLFRNDDGRLAAVELDGPAAPVDQTAVIPLPDGTGRTRVVVGLSSYEAPTAEAPSVPGMIALGWEGGALGVSSLTANVAALAPGHPSATGPIAAADYDGDGRLDLFVGGRVVPGRYPEPATSRLFRGQPDGRFAPDRRDTIFEGIGLVSGALFSDVDVDGDPDLVLSMEWGPIRVLLNQRGRFTEATEALGLEAHTSRWNGIASGDFDGDGRPDLVATSWGLNTEYRATAERPLEVYFGDVDRNGTFEVIESQRDDRLGAVAPLASLPRLAGALPSILEAASTHHAYAETRVDAVLGPDIEGPERVTGLAHMIFLNRPDGFEAYPLPVEAQWAPSLGAVVADANGDGYEDVFLAQNFFASDEDSPRYDSGRGLWLEGNGQGGFEAVSAARSGIALYGDQRGVATADVDGDGRVDLAVGQNGGPVRLYRNRGATPGLRVRLEGPSANPYAIGASLRVLYGEVKGPRRELRAGSGTGSHDEPVFVMGLSDRATGIEIQWPDGSIQQVELAPGQREITVRAGG